MELRENSAPEEIREPEAAVNRETEESVETTTVEAAEATSADTDEKPEATQEAPRYTTKEEVINALEALSEKDGAEIGRDEVTRLKLAFFAMRKNDLALEKQEFLDRGNEEAAFAPRPCPEEERFQELHKIIREKKAAHLARIEEEQQEHLSRKKAIIEELLGLATDTDNINRAFPRFRELTQEFKTVGEVPPTDATEVYRAYSAAVEHFYDQLKINKDLRDYDFKKNLEQKQLLLAEAEKLGDEKDVIIAFRRLQELHDKWREIGPVAKEFREEIWNKFKDASAVVNKRYQVYFEERKAAERENEAKKTELCERIEAIDLDQLNGSGKWEAMTKTVLELQAEWRNLGFASKKSNNTLFARFREACDRFFARKAEYFKTMRDVHSENLAKKIAICERAEAIKESSDWKKTADALTAMQEEWKKIGPVDKKHSDAVWKRFREACDYFFDRRKKDSGDTRRTEQANLRRKQDVVARLKAIPADASRDEVRDQLKELQTLWQSIGHVPFRSKDKVYEEYRAAVDALYEQHDLREIRSRRADFSAQIEEMAGDGGNKLSRERERLARVLEQRRNELKTYDNNMGFFNFSSKSGNSLQRDMERKMQRLRDDIADLESKIGEIDARM